MRISLLNLKFFLSVYDHLENVLKSPCLTLVRLYRILIAIYQHPHSFIEALLYLSKKQSPIGVL